MNITLVQHNLAWEDKAANLRYYEQVLSELSGKTDLVVLPEMCTTGFSMNVDALAETNDGPTLSAFSRMASSYGMAIAGSFIAKDPLSHRAFNRGFFLFPDGTPEFRDKRHLFRMGEESNHYQSGNDKGVISYKGWNIRLLICYDLRFPVWSRNVGNDYDLLLFCANWPEPRRKVWNSLLVARALENQCYVCGVNRIGADGSGLNHVGDSCLINAYGETLTSIEPGIEAVETVSIDLDSLHRFREKFPVWKDADAFKL
jgi:predicted amidohydrolase